MVTDKTVSAVAAPPATSFGLFLLCSFILLGRPQDILPFLQPLRPALVFTILAVVAMVFAARRKELSAALSTPESKRFLLFFLIMILGIPFAYHKGIAFQGVVEGYFVNVLFFLLVVFHITSLQKLKSLVWVICLCTLMYSVLGGFFQTEHTSSGRFRLVGQMFDPNDTAYLLVSLFPLSFYFVRCDEGLLKRLIAIAAIVGAIVILLKTGSRGGVLALGAVLLVLLLTNAGGIGRGYKTLLLLTLASIWLLIGDWIDVGRYLTLFDVSTDYNVASEGGRFALWNAAIDLALANPITGVGVHCFPWAYFLARDLTGDSYRQWHDVHNSFLQIGAEVGLIGFGIFVLINLRSALTFFRISRARSHPHSAEAAELRVLSGLMLLGFVGLSVSGFFLSQGYSLILTLYFALAAAIGRLQAGLQQTREAVDASARPVWWTGGKTSQNEAR